MVRLTRVEHEGAVYLGDADPARGVVRLLSSVDGKTDPAIDFIRTGELNGALAEPEPVGFDAVRFLPPIVQPSKNVLCVGKNYLAHAEEFSRSGFDSSAPATPAESVPEAVIMFSKAPCSLLGAYEPVQVPWALTSKVDYEAELAVVIGRGGRNIRREDALAHVWGYTVINDLTARDLQARHRQWLLGKSIDGFCPIGPWIVSADEVQADDLDVSCWVNGERRQHANTRLLIFDIPAIIAAASASMTLSPGDIIASGTPAGVGIGFDPPKFLSSGDVVRVEISGIGHLENRIV